MLELGAQEPDVFLQHVEIERLVRHRGVDAETTSIGAAEAGEHRNALDHRRLAYGRLDERPALARRCDLLWLRGRGHRPADRPMPRAVLQPFTDELLGGEAQHGSEVVDG